MPTLPLRMVAQLFNTSAMTSVSLEGSSGFWSRRDSVSFGHGGWATLDHRQLGREVAKANMWCSDLLREF